MAPSSPSASASIIPEWYQRAFAGLKGSNVVFFGEALQLSQPPSSSPSSPSSPPSLTSTSTFVVVVISEGVIYLAQRDGTIISGNSLDDLYTVTREGEVDVVSFQDRSVLYLQSADAVLYDSLQRSLYESMRGLRNDDEQLQTEQKETPYIAADDICTVCDTGGELYEPALWFCRLCDEKFCTECWDQVHYADNSVLQTHPRERLVVQGPVSVALRGTPLSPQSPPPPSTIDTTEPPIVLTPPPPVQALRSPPRREGGGGGGGGIGCFLRYPGYFLPKGGDTIPPRLLSEEDALRVAENLPICKGFTFKVEGGGGGRRRRRRRRGDGEISCVF